MCFAEVQETRTINRRLIVPRRKRKGLLVAPRSFGRDPRAATNRRGAKSTTLRHPVSRPSIPPLLCQMRLTRTTRWPTRPDARGRGRGRTPRTCSRGRSRDAARGTPRAGSPTCSTTPSRRELAVGSRRPTPGEMGRRSRTTRGRWTTPFRASGSTLRWCPAPIPGV